MVVKNNSTALVRPRLQALLRAFEKSLTPHSWEIFWTPETAKVQLGGDNRGATRHAQVAMSDCLQDSGVEESVALEISGDAVGNATVVDHSDHSGSWSAGAAEVQGGWTSTTDAIEYAEDTHVVAANAVVTGCVGRAAEAVADYESAFATGGVKGGTCLQWLLTDGTSFFGRCSPRRVLWGVNMLMLVYAVALTAGVARWLTALDATMRARLEHTIVLTESCAELESRSPNDAARARWAQREFVLQWELAAMVGGVAAYVVGKVWNDTLVGSGGIAEHIKAHSHLYWALVTTVISIIFAVAESSGWLDIGCRKSQPSYELVPTDDPSAVLTADSNADGQLAGSNVERFRTVV
jgi:hypothetical protein